MKPHRITIQNPNDSIRRVLVMAETFTVDGIRMMIHHPISTKKNSTEIEHHPGWVVTDYLTGATVSPEILHSKEYARIMGESVLSRRGLTRYLEVQQNYLTTYGYANGDSSCLHPESKLKDAQDESA